MSRTETLAGALREAIGGKLTEVIVALGEVTAVVRGADQLEVARTLRNDRSHAFEELVDPPGIDYARYGDGTWNGPRYAVVMHLLSEILAPYLPGGAPAEGRAP